MDHGAMGKARRRALGTLWTRPLLLAGFGLIVVAGCGGGAPDSAEGDESENWDGDVVAATRMLRPQEGTDADWAIFREKVDWARSQGLDTVPMGQAMVEIGQSFVGTPYGAATLEVAGDEDVVINFQELDCVTFVENTLALALFIRRTDPALMNSEVIARDRYRGTLQEIRYRGGRVDGYPSRLHYFSDWIQDNEGKGLVRELTADLGGLEDTEVIDFMSTHVDAYRQMANRANVTAIQQIEYQLSGLKRFLLPEDRIGDYAEQIQDGDVIAATSTVEGLDVTHTGLALWRDGELHLLHAPLVGGVVEVSEQPLADRILRISGQDGIRVVRPLGVSEEGGSRGPNGTGEVN